MTLEDFRPGVRAQTRRAVARKLPWRRPVRDDLGLGKLLVFDQSLSKTGFVAMSHDGTPAGLLVHDAQTLRGRAPDGTSGREKDYGEYRDLLRQLLVLLLPYSADGHKALEGWQVLHEMPPLGSSMRSPESSLLAAAAVEAAAMSLGLNLLPQMPVITHRTRVAGRNSFREPGEREISSGENKRRYHVEVVLTAESVGLPMGLVKNDGQRDAVALGMAELIGRTS